MLASERSTGTLVLAFVAAAIVGAAYFAPWLQYDYSSGRQTAEGGFHDPADTGLERQNVDYRPGKAEGNAPPADPADAEQATLWLLVAWAVGLGAFALMGLGEFPVLAA